MAIPTHREATAPNQTPHMTRAIERARTTNEIACGSDQTHRPQPSRQPLQQVMDA
jgi:hypothetical protein